MRFESLIVYDIKVWVRRDACVVCEMWLNESHCTGEVQRRTIVRVFKLISVYYGMVFALGAAPHQSNTQSRINVAEICLREEVARGVVTLPGAIVIAGDIVCN